MTNIPKATGWQRDLVIWLDRRIFSLSQNWLTVFNLAVFIYVGLPFAAPAFMKAGWTAPANAIYTAYAPLCHQFGFRSWFLFGEKPYYESADFKAATGIDSADLQDRWAAKAFVGNEKMGYKVAYCERDVAIYAGILIAGMLFGLARKFGVTIKPIHWLAYGLVGIAPIALDGFSQLFSQAPFYLVPYRESTPLLRTLTGFLFGAANVWLAYPYVEESFAEVEVELKAKLARVDSAGGNPQMAAD